MGRGGISGSNNLLIRLPLYRYGGLGWIVGTEVAGRSRAQADPA